VDYPVIEPDEQKIDHLVSGIQKKFGLELLGIDVIIENGTGRYGVIDINAFPGTTTLVLSAALSTGSYFLIWCCICGFGSQIIVHCFDVFNWMKERYPACEKSS